IERHPQERDLRHAVTNAREKNVERRERRKRVTDVRHQPDQRIQPEPPSRSRYPKKPVQIMRQILEAFFDLDLPTLFFGQVTPRSWIDFLHNFRQRSLNR